MAKENAKKSLNNKKNSELLRGKNGKHIKLKSPKIENSRFKNSNIKLDKNTIKKKNFKRQLKANIVANSKKTIENNTNISIEKDKNKPKSNTSIDIDKTSINIVKDEFKNSNINTLGSSNNIKSNKKSSVNLKSEIISKKNDNNLQSKILDKKENRNLQNKVLSKKETNNI